MNLSQIKNIFAGVWGFWILMGIGFFIVIVSLLVFIHPLSNQRLKNGNDLQGLADELGKYVVKKDLYNGAWIESKTLEANLYEKETMSCKSFLKEMDERLEAVFIKEDAERGALKIEDEALWKSEYLKRTAALREQLQIHNISLNMDALPFQNWGSDIPAWSAILPVQKRYWIIESLVHVITNTVGVTKLEMINFRELSHSYDPSLAEVCAVIPVTLKVELQAGRLEFLLYEILKSDIPFVIEGITILSTDKVINIDRHLEQDVSDRVFGPIIDVTVDAYVIDYKA